MGVRDFLGFVWSRYRVPTFMFFAVTVVSGFLEGAGLTLLIPLLNLIGLTGSENNKVTQFIADFYETIGVQLNLISVLVTIFFIVSFHALFLWWQQVTAVKIEQKLVWDLRSQLFEKLLRADWNLISSKPQGQLSGVLIRETERVGQALQFLATGIGFGFLILVYLLWAAMMSWKLAAAVFIGSAAILILFRKRVQQGRRNGEVITRENLNLTQYLQESLYALKMVKASAIEPRAATHFTSLAEKFYKTWVAAAHNGASIRALAEPIAVLILCCGIYFSVSVFHIDGATLLVLLFIFFKTLPRLTEFQRTWNNFLFTIPAFQAVEGLNNEMTSTTGSGSAPISFNNEICFENVSFRYPTGPQILENTSLTILKGQMIGIVGASGGGKSTLVDLLIGLQSPQRGQIKSDGKTLAPANSESWRKKIAYVSQETILLHDTVENNLKWLSPTASTSQVWEALRLAHADAFVLAMPEGLQTIIGDRGTKISGGQRQRLALARALLQKPEILILDEATSALDAETEKFIQEAIESQKGHLTLVVIAHRIGTLRKADRIFQISQGKVVEQIGGSQNEASL